MTLRPWLPADAPGMLHLFHETVRKVNVRDYSPEQVAAWAPASPPDLDRWRQRLAGQSGMVAEIDGALVGFCTWTDLGYLDFLYVHHEHQRAGIATALYAAAERAMRDQGVALVHTQASITAQPFFLRMGFRLVKHQLVLARGVELPNAVMEKPLG